jgi:acyl carrier protein
MPATQSPAERELAELIINAVNLEGVAPVDVVPQAPQFGAGRGVDAKDALVLAGEISKP